MANICINCDKGFNTWACTSLCDNCEDGHVESTRDYGWDRDGLMVCYKCNGTTEIKTKRQDFCSEECIDEYFDKK